MSDADQEPPQKPPEQPEARRQAGSLEKLAQRSTGLPDRSSKVPEKSSPTENPLRFAGMGVQFVGTTVVFGVMGYLIDRRMGWTPWAMLTLTMIGLVGSFYLLLKEALKINK